MVCLCHATLLRPAFCTWCPNAADRGYGATLSSFGPFSAFYFGLYEQFKASATSVRPAGEVQELPMPVVVWYACKRNQPPGKTIDAPRD